MSAPLPHLWPCREIVSGLKRHVVALFLTLTPGLLLIRGTSSTDPLLQVHSSLTHACSKGVACREEVQTHESGVPHSSTNCGQF